MQDVNPHITVSEALLSKRWTVEAAQAKGQQLLESARIGLRSYDVLKLQRSLRMLCVEDPLPSAARAIALEVALAPVPKDESVQVVVGLVCSVRDEQLQKMPRGMLLTLKEVLSLGEVEATSASTHRIDEELSRRGEVVIHDVEGVKLVCDGLPNEVIGLAMAQALQWAANPEKKESLNGQLVLVTLDEDRGADMKLIQSHLIQCGRKSFGSPLEALVAQSTGLQRLQAHALIESAPPVQPTVRMLVHSFLRGVMPKAAKPRSVPMALLLSVQQ